MSPPNHCAPTELLELEGLVSIKISYGMSRRNLLKNTTLDLVTPSTAAARRDSEKRTPHPLTSLLSRFGSTVLFPGTDFNSYDPKEL